LPFIGNLAPLMFVAFVPLMLVENHIYKNRLRPRHLFVHSYLTFLIYNVGTTWWIWNASPIGAIFAFVLNSFIMALVFQVIHFTKRNGTASMRNWAFVCCWLGFEFLHFQWELSWPWLQLGNVFSRMTPIVQWYSYVGVLGGTCWILISNLFVFGIVESLIVKGETFRSQQTKSILWLGWIVLPILISLIQYETYTEKGSNAEVVITQPNIDPYNEKFTGSVKDQLNKICDLADRKTTKNTDFVLAPETALPFSFYEDEVERIIYYPYLIERKAHWPKASLLIGASTQRFFKKKRSRASIKLEGGPGYEEFYNSSMMIDQLDQPSFIHKSKLVLGVEKIPFSNIFPFLEDLAIKNGGTSGTLGIEDESQVFQSNGITFAPVVCYESIYGEFIAQQCRKGAELIFIITNDGWWGDTPGYKQHMSFARLRAIENRRSVARSANTGISCFINQKGDVLESSSWWKEGSLRANLQRNKQLTIYAKIGDILGKAACVIALILWMTAMYKKVKAYFSK
jgi:apolipoprotein N-acyltransferase